MQEGVQYRIILSDKAGDALQDIWNWTLSQHGVNQAELYQMQILDAIDLLALNPLLGTALERDPEVRFLLLTGGTGNDGHVAIYVRDDVLKTIKVTNIFHTKQDWQNAIKP